MSVFSILATSVTTFAFQSITSYADTTTCEATQACEGDNISGYDTVNCYGYLSCYDANITNVGEANCDGYLGCYGATVETDDAVNCIGATACYEATLNSGDRTTCYGNYGCLYADVNGNETVSVYGNFAGAYASISADDTIDCRGSYGCAFADDLVADTVSCSGKYSCIYEDFDTTVADTLYVSGDGAGAVSTFTDIEEIYAYGSLALLYSNIEVAGPGHVARIYLGGYLSGYGLNITCESDTTCKLFCSDSGCDEIDTFQCCDDATCETHNCDEAYCPNITEVDCGLVPENKISANSMTIKEHKLAFKNAKSLKEKIQVFETQIDSLELLENKVLSELANSEDFEENTFIGGFMNNVEVLHRHHKHHASGNGVSVFNKINNVYVIVSIVVGLGLMSLVCASLGFLYGRFDFCGNNNGYKLVN